MDPWFVSDKIWRQRRNPEKGDFWTRVFDDFSTCFRGPFLCTKRFRLPFCTGNIFWITYLFFSSNHCTAIRCLRKYSHFIFELVFLTVFSTHFRLPLLRSRRFRISPICTDNIFWNIYFFVKSLHCNPIYDLWPRLFDGFFNSLS